jgi:hypothetical protein
VQILHLDPTIDQHFECGINANLDPSMQINADPDPQTLGKSTGLNPFSNKKRIFGLRVLDHMSHTPL